MKLEATFADKAFAFKFTDHDYTLDFSKTFGDDDVLADGGKYTIKEVARADTTFNERYAFFDGDKRLAHAYTKGSASPYAVAYEANMVRGNVKGGNGNYFQGGSCAKSSEAFAVGVLVLLNNVNTKVAIDAINELAKRHDLEIDDKHHLRGPDVGHSMALLYDALAANDQADGNAFIGEMKSWSTGSPFNLLDVGVRGDGPDALDIASLLWIRDINKRGTGYFAAEEIEKATNFINEANNGTDQRAALEKTRQKGGGLVNKFEKGAGGADDEKQTTGG